MPEEGVAMSGDHGVANFTGSRCAFQMARTDTQRAMVGALDDDHIQIDLRNRNAGTTVILHCSYVGLCCRRSTLLLFLPLALEHLLLVVHRPVFRTDIAENANADQYQNGRESLANNQRAQLLPCRELRQLVSTSPN